jgi:hypothetical protein
VNQESRQIIEQPLYFALDLAPQPLHVPSFWHFQTIVLDVCFFLCNDNPCSESLFRTLKYCPRWPSEGFKFLEGARQWVKGFVYWHNNEHRHSRIKFVTPNQRHEGLDADDT